MNNTIHKTIRNTGIALATLLLVAVWFAIAPKAQAADLDVGGFDYIDTYTPDGSYYDGGGYDYIDTYTPDYSYETGYSNTGGFGGGGYSFGGGGFTGGSTLGGGGFRGGSSLGGYSYSTVYAPTNTNTCTAVNSCNSYWDDHSIFNAPTTITTNTTNTTSGSGSYSYPVYVPTTYAYTQPVYTQPVYYPAPRPIAYNNTPYVTLAAVPYTGLELGPVGTALYWGFLVLWCLIAAYLIVVKKIQNKIAAWFTGSATQNSAVQSRRSEVGTPTVASGKSNTAPLLAGIDPFIQAQINRAK